MVQDFYAAFSLGGDERTIATVDAGGIALAAIQALHELVKEKETALKAQQRAFSELAARVEVVERALSAK
jgi:trimeric autotransporter adhesin